MVDNSRLAIYDYLRPLFEGVITDNVYLMGEPQELTDDDRENGFIVIRVGDVRDESEFDMNAYGYVRAYVEAYVPPMSRGRVDTEKYQAFEEGIAQAIQNEIANGTDEHFSIQSDGILSMEDVVDTNANNMFYLYVKSFIVNID